MTVDRVEKLIPNLSAKARYAIHHRNLKQYLSLGMKLKSTGRGIRFTFETVVEKLHCEEYGAQDKSEEQL